MPTPIDEKALGNLIRMLNPYSTDMHQPSTVPPIPASASRELSEADHQAQFHIEIHDHYANYTSAEWVFRGQPQTIKKALRITYRYPLGDTGFYATEHLLIGYAGGNGP